MTVPAPLYSTLTIPEGRPAGQSSGSLQPADTLQPQVGVYYDAVGNPHQAYMEAPPPPGVTSASLGTAAPGSFVAVTPSDTVALPTGVQGLIFGGALTALSVKGINNTVAVALGPQAAGTTLRGQFGFVMATGTTGTGTAAIVAMI